MIDHEALGLLLAVEQRYALYSSPAHAWGDPDMKAVIERGAAVIPTLIYAISVRGEEGYGLAPWLCAHALHLITGEQPIPDEHFGSLSAVLLTWREWAFERGITPATD